MYKEIKKESKLYGYAFVQKPTDEKEAQKAGERIEQYAYSSNLVSENRRKTWKCEGIVKIYRKAGKSGQKKTVSSKKRDVKSAERQSIELSYEEIGEILKEQRLALSKDIVLGREGYNIENFETMLNSFYISPRIKRIGNGEVCSDYDVQKKNKRCK